tara:strand:- start:520 stop:1647 length:1128 start_codon:yes stop_codon:yes gene_type:complete
MRAFFVGAFDEVDGVNFRGSAAGAKVQTEIIEALSSQLEFLAAFVMPERPSWPADRLFVKGIAKGFVKFLPILNLGPIKKPWFFCALLFYFFRQRPDILFQYNSSISGALFSSLARLFSCKSVLILQDINAPVSFNGRLLLKPREFLGYVYTKLISLCFDLYIPISRSSIEDLGLPEDRCMVFQGAALKSFIRSANQSFIPNSRCMAVFAGALEEYNGIDILVKNWPSPEEFECQLNIFGKGSLQSYVESVCSRNPNIEFHGFRSPVIVDNYILKADFNFCLRYSKGIEQSYFFPSKFFDMILSHGLIICNDFDNIPSDLREYLVFIDEDLKSLVDILKKSQKLHPDRFSSKVEFIKNNYTWFGFFGIFFSKFKL